MLIAIRMDVKTVEILHAQKLNLRQMALHETLLGKRNRR
jgi:hypothetical protein